MNKAEIRRQVQAKRKTLDPLWIAEKSGLIQNRIAGLPEFRKARVVCCYLAMPHEVNTGEIIAACWKQEKTVCVPAFNADLAAYELAAFERDTSVGKGPANVPEPAEKNWVGIERVELILAPGLAFDRFGGRVGHGAGYYDRIMGDGRAASIPKAGLAFEFQLFDNIPMEQHDVWLDMVITENRVIRSMDRAVA